MVKIQLFENLSFAKYVKTQQNSAFQPKPKAVAEKFSAQKQTLTYLGKVKKNQISHQGNFFHGSHNKKGWALCAPPPPW